jgi:hypothetical protein
LLNPVLSREEKLNRFKKIVRASDEKMKPLLSTTQLQKLQDLRKEQKRNLAAIIEKQKSGELTVQMRWTRFNQRPFRLDLTRFARPQSG